MSSFFPEAGTQAPGSVGPKPESRRLRMSTNLTRRRFLRTSVAQGALLSGALPAARRGKVHLLDAMTGESAKAYSAGDQIGLALIGAGGRGQDDTQTALEVPGVRLVAAADCYDGRLVHCKERWGADVFTTRDYREILARSDVDAVLIATSDHWHKQAAIDAMQAGKDVYLEKPMIHLYSDGPEIIETARRTGRILQVGSQRVSSIIYKQARKLLESGAIGKINVVNAWWDRNPGNPVLAFNSTIPPDASPET